MRNLSKFAERLSEFMEEREITANQLAKELKISGTSVRKYRRDGSEIALPYAIRIADYFCCNLDYLAGRTEFLETVRPRPLPPFYERLRAVMAELGVSRYRIAKKTSIKDSYFTHWAHGELPRLSSVCAIAKYLDVSLDYLTGRTDY